MKRPQKRNKFPKIWNKNIKEYQAQEFQSVPKACS